MDWGLLAEVAGLGLAAVDVIGIAFMPILLAQADGLRRAATFLAGSFVALVLMGLLFTTGIGSVIADVNQNHPWLEPGIEVVGGVVILGVGLFMLWRTRSGEVAHAPDNLVEKLELPKPLLFAFGAVLVTVQSLVDVVFVVAMVDIGTRDLPFPEVLLLVLTYAVAALLIQVLVVVAYLVAPAHRRAVAMASFADWLGRRGEFWGGVVSVVLGVGLLVTSTPDLVRALQG
jgi:hypothetical protein